MEVVALLYSVCAIEGPVTSHFQNEEGLNPGIRWVKPHLPNGPIVCQCELVQNSLYGHASAHSVSHRFEFFTAFLNCTEIVDCSHTTSPCL